MRDAEHDRLFDPEDRGQQHDFVKGQPREGEARLRFVVLWQCGVPSHGECWSTGHLSTREVANETLTHTADCACWRHTVLAYALENRREPHRALATLRAARLQESLAKPNPFFDAFFEAFEVKP